MRLMRLAVELLRPFLAAALAILAADGCLPKTQVAPKDAYAMELQGCVLAAQTLEASKACRADVDRRYGVKR